MHSKGAIHMLFQPCAKLHRAALVVAANCICGPDSHCHATEEAGRKSSKGTEATVATNETKAGEL